MITLTDNAISKVKLMLEKENKKDNDLRVQVLPGGCAGFRYNLVLDKTKKSDVIFDNKGLKVVIDKDALKYVDGLTIDYADGLMESGFKINNPQAKATCGCGHSFS